MLANRCSVDAMQQVMAVAECTVPGVIQHSLITTALVSQYCAFDKEVLKDVFYASYL